MLCLISCLKFISLELISLALNSDKLALNVTNDSEQMSHSVLQHRTLLLQLLVVSIYGILRLFNLLQTSVISVRYSAHSRLTLFQESLVALEDTDEMSRGELVSQIELFRVLFGCLLGKQINFDYGLENFVL